MCRRNGTSGDRWRCRPEATRPWRCPRHGILQRQSFYLYFLPLFAEDSVGDEADSVYVRLNKLNADIKEKICLWAASRALENSVPTNQKENYKQLGKRYFKELRDDFNEEFWKVGEMVYQGASQPL